MKKGRSEENVLVFCAHPDDEVFGVGGTAAKYANEGIPVSAAIMTCGEASHPWMEVTHTVKTRIKESQIAGEMIGYEEIVFFGLQDGALAEQIQTRRAERMIRELILEKKPTKLFTHSIDDKHVAHRAVHKAVLRVLDKLRYNCEVYTFAIWDPFALAKKNRPRLIVDISKTFDLKLKALQRFKSQQSSYWSLLPSVYLSAVVNGFNYRMKYAEVFRKVR